MTGYNVRLRASPRIRIFSFQANLGNIILTAVCPATKALPPEKRAEIAEKQLKRDGISPNPLEYFFEVLCILIFIFAVIFYAETRGNM